MRIDELIRHLTYAHNPTGKVSVKVEGDEGGLDYPMARLEINEDGVVLVGAKTYLGSMVLRTTEHQCGAKKEIPSGEAVSPCHLPVGHKGDHEGWCLGSRAVWDKDEDTGEAPPPLRRHPSASPLPGPGRE